MAPSPVLDITLFTDPACPFAFSAEPTRMLLRWHYGDQLRWGLRMIVLTQEPGEAEKLSRGAPSLQRRYGMPIDPEPRERPASSEPACHAVVAARLHAPEAEEPLLRRLRIRTMAGGLLDDPQLIDGAARDARLDPDRLREWCQTAEVQDALAADAAAAREPSAAARALDDRLGGPREQRRYTAPSYEFSRPDSGATFALPGFNPIEAYDAAIANLAPELERRPRPDGVDDVLAWAGEPLATAEIAALTRLDMTDARAALTRAEAQATPVGADTYWNPKESS